MAGTQPLAGQVRATNARKFWAFSLDGLGLCPNETACFVVVKTYF